MIRVALTGGPAGGKSTLQRTVEHEMPEVHCVPEAATVLLSGGYPAPSEKHPWTPNWQRSFQLAVIAVQQSLEQTFNERAINSRELILFDRGLPDAAAYLPGGMRDLEKITGRSEQQILNSYQVVLHLPTTAAHGNYDQDSNPHRLEGAEEALRLEARILDVWAKRPNRIVVDDNDKTLRIVKALEILRGLV